MRFCGRENGLVDTYLADGKYEFPVAWEGLCRKGVMSESSHEVNTGYYSSYNSGKRDESSYNKDRGQYPL